MLQVNVARLHDDTREALALAWIAGREGGTGLGLTIAQTFVTQHSGTIEWESAPGHTVFTILLPLEMTRPLHRE